eukprot:5022395-Heterocapsa_arctica.AAC.1
MEEDDVEDVLHADWRRQRAEDNFILANQNVYPTTYMATMIKVEDLMTTEERLQGAQICQKLLRT